MLKAFNIMSKRVVSVPYTAPIGEAASLMLEEGIGSLAVQKGGKIAGVVTSRDFVKLQVMDERVGTIEGIMSTPPIKVEFDSELVDIIRVMGEKKIGHLFVEQDGKILGVITLRDIIVSAPEFILSYIMEKLTDFDIPSFK